MTPKGKLLRALLFLIMFCVAYAPAFLWAQGNSDARARTEAKLTKAPKLKKQVEAKYTQQAIDKRIEGKVILQITIDAKGKVSQAKVVSGPGYGLNEAALVAIKKFEFEPAEVNNKPAPVTLKFTISFSLPILPSTFKGQVVDKSSKKGLGSVKVEIRYTGTDYKPAPYASTTTKSDGGFTFTNVPPGPYSVTITPPSKYTSFVSKTTLVAGKTSESTFTLDALPQNYIGEVLERGTRKPLPAMKIELIDLSKDLKSTKVVEQTYTDAKGKFGFRGLKTGLYAVRMSGQGYLTRTFKENIKLNDVLSGRYFIEAKFYDKYTVRTKSKRQAREVTRRTLKLEEIRRIPGTNGDVVRVVQNLPGVARPRFLGGQIIVRGAAPQDTQLFLEGDEIPNVFHFLFGPAVINSEMLEAVEFFPGNFDVQYGRATAGIINLKVRSPKTDRLHGYAKIDLIDSTLLLEGPINKDWSFAISGRRSYIDQVIQPFLPEEASTLVAPRYYDYQGWLTYRGMKDSLIELRLYGSDDKLALLSPEDEDEEDELFGFASGFLRGQLRWVWRPKGPIQNELMAAFGRNSNRLNAGPFLFDSGKYQAFIRNNTKIQLHKRAELRLGIDMVFARTDVDIIIPQSNRQNTSAPPPDTSTGDDAYGGDLSFLSSLESQGVLFPAYYVDALLKPFDGTELVPGIRLDYYGTIGKASFSPRLTVRQQLHKTFIIKGGAGLYTQAPQLIYSNQIFGNSDLKPEKALQYAVGAEWQLRDYFKIDATLFYRDMYDLVVDDFQVDANENNGDEIDVQLYSNRGEGRAYGLELLVKHDLSERFFGWIAYTLSRSERKNLQTGKFDIYRNDQTHILTLVAGYKLPYGIDITGRFRLVSGYPNTPVIDRTYDTDTNEFEPVYGETNSGREPAFHQLDLRVDKTFIFNAWRLGVYLDVINVYDAKNVEQSFYSYDYSETRNITGIPFLPTLGVTARW